MNDTETIFFPSLWLSGSVMSWMFPQGAFNEKRGAVLPFVFYLLPFKVNGFLLRSGTKAQETNQMKPKENEGKKIYRERRQIDRHLSAAVTSSSWSILETFPWRFFLTVCKSAPFIHTEHVGRFLPGQHHTASRWRNNRIYVKVNQHLVEQHLIFFVLQTLKSGICVLRFPRPCLLQSSYRCYRSTVEVSKCAQSECNGSLW